MVGQHEVPRDAPATRAWLVQTMGGEHLLRSILEAVRPYGVRADPAVDIGNLVYPDDANMSPRFMRVTRGPAVHSPDWQLYCPVSRVAAIGPEYVAKQSEIMATLAVLEQTHVLVLARELKIHTFRFSGDENKLQVKDAYLAH